MPNTCPSHCLSHRLFTLVLNIQGKTSVEFQQENMRGFELLFSLKSFLVQRQNAEWLVLFSSLYLDEHRLIPLRRSNANDEHKARRVWRFFGRPLWDANKLQGKVFQHNLVTQIKKSSFACSSHSKRLRWIRSPVSVYLCAGLTLKTDQTRSSLLGERRKRLCSWSSGQ